MQEYVAQRLGAPDGVLIVNDTGFLKRGVVSTGVQRQYSGTARGTEIPQVNRRPSSVRAQKFSGMQPAHSR